MGITAAVGHTRNRSTHHITNREDERTFGFGELDSGEGVRRLAGLRDGNDDIVFVDDRLAVTELGRVFHLHGYLRELLNGVHSYQPGMPGGAAGCDDDTLGIQETLFVINETGESDVILAYVHTPSHGVRQRARLLKYFLEHEMRIAPFLQLTQRQLETLDLRRLLHVIDGRDVYRTFFFQLSRFFQL